MKKMLALILALMMALSCAIASAETVYTKLTIDRDVAKSLMTSFGEEDSALESADAVLAVINALGVNVITADEGVQIDLDLNGTQALSLGVGADDDGLVVVSDLFPSYAVTVKAETVTSLLESVQQNMGSANGNGSMSLEDISSMTETFSGYYTRWMEAVVAAAQPGDPVTGEYEYEGYTFDTMVPVTLDMAAMTDATKSLMDELLSDPAAVTAIQSGMKSSGSDFNEAEFRTAFEEWLSHFPETASAEWYCNSDGSEPFYMYAEGSRDTATYVSTMFYKSANSFDMRYQSSENPSMDIGFSLDGTDAVIDFTLDDVFFGLSMSFPEGQFLCDVYFVDSEKPLANLTVTYAEGGALTMDASKSGKTVMAPEDAMEDGSAAEGLGSDIMTNGLGKLMTAMGAVPELSSLMGSMMG